MPATRNRPKTGSNGRHTPEAVPVLEPPVVITEPTVATAASPPEVVQEFNEGVTATAETMLQGCSKLRARFSWFSTSAKIDDDTLSEMIGEHTPQTIKDAIVASKRLMKSKHPALMAAKASFQAIKDHVNSMTIPLVAVRSTAAADAGLRKDGGVRLIQKKDMAEFDRRMQYLIAVLGTSVEALQLALPEIMEEDRARLDKANKNLFKRSDYPTDVTKIIGVEYGFEPIGIDVEWNVLCPEIFRRERANAKAKFEAVVETAAVEFADRFVKYVRQVTEQLGNRIRLRPTPAFQRVKVQLGDEVVTVDVDDAERLTLLTHADDEDIPEGFVMVELRLKKAAKGKSSEVWLAEPMPQSDFFGNLRPYEVATEKRKLYDSTVDNLKAQLETFANIGEMLGPYKSVVERGINTVKGLLGQASSTLDTERISKELREGNYFRNQMKTALEGVAAMVTSQVTEAKAMRRVVKKSLIGQV